MNNTALGNPLLRSKKIGERESTINVLPTQNWAKFAESLNITGIYIDSPEDLHKVFLKALDTQKPILIDICGGSHYPTPTYKFDQHQVNNAAKPLKSERREEKPAVAV
jgi:thiamine pyrophosphate-dependent acetolactate synthase large subunit-like protein